MSERGNGTDGGGKPPGAAHRPADERGATGERKPTGAGGTAARRGPSDADKPVRGRRQTDARGSARGRGSSGEGGPVRGRGPSDASGSARGRGPVMAPGPDGSTEPGGEWKQETTQYAIDPDRLFLPPDDDLAPNRPGEALRSRLAEQPRGAAALLFARVLGRHPPQDAWRGALLAASAVGAELDGLGAGGWYVLHSVPLPPNAVIDHLLIGPGGVLCVQDHHVPRARVRVGGDEVRTGRRGQVFPYVRWCRQAAHRASYVLTRGCGFAVRVRPVLAFVGAARVEVDPGLRGIRVARDEREAAALGALGGVLAPERVERVHTVARNRRTWLAA
ncbi:NERD domain-containing protein [Streptomyces sp. NPDC003077]|uniref:NERD domain-containing protein n=1 Tax=Streptomyces sp. NPDC003077 TaxID=3154443 RepID=UPI0033B05F24